MNSGSLQREAVLAAEYVLAETGISPGDPVPIFDIIEDRGIWLSFETDLDRLLGTYLRVGNAAGIAVNAARPLPLQRFTAAHELGHHELGHESHLDLEESMTDPSQDPRELQAQTFAASLLMSELAVEALLERRGHDPDRPDLSAVDVYSISAELGVSYQAALTQLRVLSKISAASARELGKASPLQIKRMLLGGRRPDDAWASVRRLTLADNQGEVVLNVSDEIDIALPEMPASGCEWELPSDIGHLFAVVNDRRESSGAEVSGTLFGAADCRHVTLKACKPGRTRLDFLSRYPGDGDGEGASLTIHAVTRALPVSGLGHGISTNQHDQILAHAPA